MPSISAPGGAYHYRKHKWGARRETAWRQAVKDKSGCGRVRERRRKITIDIVENSDGEPTLMYNQMHNKRVCVGERWGGRGEAVDAYLEEIAALPPERHEVWNVTNCAGSLVLSVTLRERLNTNRNKLQFHFTFDYSCGGELANRFINKIQALKPNWIAMTPESRMEVWGDIVSEINGVMSKIISEIQEWEGRRHNMLWDIGAIEPSEAGTRINSHLEISDGEFNDTQGRFTVRWALPTVMYSLDLLVWNTYSLIDGITVPHGDANPREVFQKLGEALDMLPLAQSVVGMSERIIYD